MRKIRKFTKYVNQISKNGKFRIAVVSDRSTKDIINQLGFSDENTYGVPNLIKGIKTLEENITGVMSINKSEKEYYIRYFHWHNIDWHGNEHSGVASIWAKRYKREYTTPLCLELFMCSNGTESFLCSQELTNNDDNEEVILAYLNIFRETFGYFNVLDSNLNEPIKTRKVSWEILPAGHINDYIKCLSERVRHPERIIKEHERLFDALTTNYSPIEIVGVHGFQGYVAFVYPNKNFVILENLIYGNATYVIDKDKWEDASKLTKQEVLNSKLFIKKIIHSPSWLNEIKKLLGEH